MTFPFHPAYGLPDEVRAAILRDAERDGVKAAAIAHGVSQSAIYLWRKVARENV